MYWLGPFGVFNWKNFRTLLTNLACCFGMRWSIFWSSVSLNQATQWVIWPCLTLTPTFSIPTTTGKEPMPPSISPLAVRTPWLNRSSVCGPGLTLCSWEVIDLWRSHHCAVLYCKASTILALVGCERQPSLYFCYWFVLYQGRSQRSKKEGAIPERV